jgi:hypothetical protein
VSSSPTGGLSVHFAWVKVTFGFAVNNALMLVGLADVGDLAARRRKAEAKV